VDLVDWDKGIRGIGRAGVVDLNLLSKIGNGKKDASKMIGIL
jgi:hypothetical protein